MKRLPVLLRRPIGLDQAKATIANRRRNRTADFLALVKKAIYENPHSPYLRLLKASGCEFGDLAKLVNRNGVEGALGVLLRRGVYLTVDEFHGRRAVTRGSTSFVLDDPSQLRNPLASAHLALRTAGSRSSGTPVALDLDFLAQCAMNRALNLAARGGLEWTHALWSIPGGGSMGRLFDFAVMGTPFVRWFSPIAIDDSRLHPRYRWSVRLMKWGSRLAGVTMPRPEYASLNNPLPILKWIEASLRSGQTPHLWAYASTAVRICQAAERRGADVRGLQLTATGEPLTEARLKTIRASGADAVPTYATVQSGPIGYGCLTQNEDFHYFDDLHALIQPGESGRARGLPENAFLISSLRSTTPLLFLNASLGDHGTMKTQTCHCAVEELGWSTHLQSVRSYEKLTTGGMTFLDGDIIRILEEVLPSQFGGGPTDYQLVETERANGLPELRLLVNPAVGRVDPKNVAEKFIASVSNGPGAERVMALAWRDAGLIRVERRPPITTSAGKILHLHHEKDHSEQRQATSSTQG